MKRNKLSFLYTNIGRGHPFYLDGILELLRGNEQFELSVSDVFNCSGGLSRYSWQFAKFLYRIGSTDSIVGRMYNRLRDSSDYNQQGAVLKIMGRDIKKKYVEDSVPLIVAHPVLVGLLSGRGKLLYQHGELAVPKQAVVSGADYVFVPTDSAAEPFINSGYSKENVVVTGLCIEPGLQRQAEQAYLSRLSRIETANRLTGVFFSSGAEPKPHMEKLVMAAASVVSEGHNVIVFAKRGGRLAHLFKRTFDRENLKFPTIDEDSQNLNLETQAMLCLYSSREVESKLTCGLFEKLDFFVAPSHERTNWALGLGLPMFILEPPIGPFSPLNREVLLGSGVAQGVETIARARQFGKTLKEMQKNGKLLRMSESGWEKHPILGFQTIADFLVNKFA